MMTFKDLGGDNFDDFWSLYESSFPQNERRTKKEQNLILARKNYRAKVVLSDGVFSGVFCYWSFEWFSFVEHFAIAKDLRSKGLGSAVMREFLKQNARVILEIDPVCDGITQKRYDFYSRLGFQKASIKHFQLPFRKGDESIELELLSTFEISNSYYKKIHALLSENLTLA